MKRSGFTLVETLIYIAVLSVFTTGLFSVFHLGNRSFRISESRSDSVQSGLVAVTSIQRLLASGANTTLQVDQTIPALTFLSAQPLEGSSFRVDTVSGKLRWQKWVCIHLDRSRKALVLTEQELLNKPTTIPPSPGFALMTGSPLQPQMSRRILARSVEDFQLQQINTRTVSYSLTTRVLPSVTSRRTRPQSVGSTTTGYFTLRN
jgi:type II secretory pathway pseudopilin PulG